MTAKGKKDRTVPIPQKIVPELIEHLEYVKQLHQRDLKSGYSGAFHVRTAGKKIQELRKGTGLAVVLSCKPADACARNRRKASVPSSRKPCPKGPEKGRPKSAAHKTRYQPHVSAQLRNTSIRGQL